MYTLNEIPLHVFDASPFQYTDLISRQRLIGDGTNDTNNEVLQSGAKPNRVAQYSVRIYDADHLDAFENLYADGTQVVFVDRRGLQHYVVVTNYQPHELQWFWEATIELTELTPATSSDLSS
jgi:hypothetical protein